MTHCVYWLVGWDLVALFCKIYVISHLGEVYDIFSSWEFKLHQC